MAHEFNIKNGFITSGQSYVYNNLTVSGITVSSVPTNDDSLTQILARDSSGNIKYRTASSLGGGGGTFTGGTVTGPTNFTAGLTANTISATTYYNLTAGGSNTQVQYNNSGVISGDTNFTWDSVNKNLIAGAQGTPVTQPTTSVILGGSGSLIENSSNSAIIGGVNNSTNSGLSNVIILGGNGLSATNSNTTYVQNFNINSTPTSGPSVTDVLVRDTDGTIKTRTASSIGGVNSVTAGSGLSGNSTTGNITLVNTQVQGVTGLTANNGLSASTTNNVTTVGFSGGNISNSTNFTGGLTVTGNLDVTNNIRINTANSTDSIAGTDWLKIDASGTVFGFSDNAPSGQGFMSVSNGTVTGFGAHVNNTDGMVFGSYNSYPLTLRTGNNNRLVISAGGDVTVNQNLNVSGGLTASTVAISSTPSTNTTDTSVLVRNSTTGNIEVRSINNLINENNTVTVALTGSTGVDFNSIKAAVNSITAATSANTYTVKVAGGLYYEDPFTIPSWVAVVGDSSLSTVIQANDASQTLINLSDQSALFDCQVQGCTGTSVAAIVYSSSTTPQSSAISYVENVRFGANYTHAKVVAYGGANIIMQCSNVKYGGYPFTIGFYTTNNGSGIGRMQLRNVTSTNGGITTTSGLIFAKTDAASCGFIVNGCLLTKAVGTAAGTGFYVENGGFLRLTAVNFQRWAVGIDAPQIGAAPSIDAIALNFENNTIDVNIAHSGATGKIQGTDSYTKTNININAPLYEVNQDPRIITVAKKGGDFTSVKSAVDSLTATSFTSRYVVEVGPGIFQEDEIDLTSKPYVSIIGSDIQATIIQPLTTSQNIFSLGTDTELSFMTISGASAGYAGISCVDLGGFALVHKISMYDNDTHILVDSSTADSTFYGEYVDLNGEYSYGTKVTSSNGFASLANMENYYNFPSGTGTTYCNYASGSGATLSIFLGDIENTGTSGTTGYYIQDYAVLKASTVTTEGCGYGILNPNIGGGVTFDVDNASFADNVWDLYVEKVDTFGTLGGSSSHQKLYTNSPNVYWSFLDTNDGEFEITRKASVTFADGTHTDFTTLVFEGGTMGLISGGTITSVGGLSAQTATGFGYLEKPGTEIYAKLNWDNSIIVLSPNTNNYLYINSSSILSASNTIPDNTENIILGRVVTNSSTIEFIDESPQKATHTSNLFSTFNRTALGPVYASGSLVTQNATPFKINVSNGDYFFSENEFTPSGGSGLTFTQYYRNGSGGWNTSATTFVQSTSFDNNGTLSGLTTSAFTKHTLYVVGDGSNEKYFLVLGQTQYTTLVETEGADLPTPPTYFNDAVTPIASIYIQQGASNIVQFEDIRPVIGFKAAGVNASSLHANLLGLTSDDHKQYLLVDGSRGMSGTLNMSGNTITNSGTINGVTIETHATRHQFGGADPVGTVTPSANAIPFADVSGKLDSWITPVTITGGTNIQINGTYPNFGVNFTGTTGSNFTGGTVTGATNFTNGLTANTISATTYQGNIVTSISAGGNINVSQATGDVTVTAVPSNNTTAIQFNDSSSFAGDDTTLAYILSQVVFVGGSASYTVGGAVTKSSIIGGESNNLSDNINRSVIIGGRSSLIRGNSISSVIIGGDTNDINNFDNTVILGGSNITATASDFVYVPSLNINTTPANDDTLTQVLVRDSSGDVKYRTASTIGGGGTFTGGTVNGSTVFTNGLTANTLTVTGTTLSLGDITGNTLVSSQSAGDEGGEIRLSKAQTNTTLSGETITIDIYQNRLRFFETGSPNRGAYIDLSTASSNAGTNLLSGGGTFTGGTVTGATIFTNGLSADTLTITTVPVLDTSPQQILTRDSTTGAVEYVTPSTLSTNIGLSFALSVQNFLT